MSIRVRLTYDGKVFIPLGKVKVPKGQPLEAEITVPENPVLKGEAWQAAFERLGAMGKSGANIPDESLRRESLYPDRI